jgi:hypothetical protein
MILNPCLPFVVVLHAQFQSCDGDEIPFRAIAADIMGCGAAGVVISPGQIVTIWPAVGHHQTHWLGGDVETICSTMAGRASAATTAARPGCGTRYFSATTCSPTTPMEIMAMIPISGIFIGRDGPVSTHQEFCDGL